MKGEREVLVFEDAAKMSQAIIGRWKDIANAAIAQRGYFSLVLSGGKTPLDLYRRISSIPGDEIPWQKTHIFFIDERDVPLQHPNSNLDMLARELFEKVNIPKENVYAVFGGSLRAEEAAAAYAEKIKRFFKLEGSELPVFDLILLGLGADGHTAALFPLDLGRLDKEERLAVKAEAQDAKEPWVTLTLPVINSAANVFMLVTGGHKAEILKKILEENADVPAAHVRPKDTKVIFWVDK